MSQTPHGLVLSGSFTATGNSENFASFRNYFNITVWGTFVGTLTLQRSFDRGQTWHNVARDLFGATMTFNAPISIVALEPENRVFYRMVCTSYTSGAINWRISQ